MTTIGNDVQVGAGLAAFGAIARLVAFMRWRVALAVLLLIAMGALEGLGIVLLVPLLGSIGLDVHAGSVGQLAAIATAALGQIGLTATLPLVLGAFLGVNLLLLLLKRTLTVFSTALEQAVIRSIVNRVYGGIVRMDWLAFSRMRASDLVVALTTSAERAGVAASQMLTVLSAFVVTGVYVGLALRVSVSMTIVTLLSGVLIMLAMRRRTAIAGHLGERYLSATQGYQAAVSDDLAGMKTIRSVAGESRSLSRLAGLADLMSEARLASARHYANGTFLVDFGALLLLSALVLVAVERLQLSASALLLLVFLFSRIVPRLSALLHNLQMLAGFLPAVRSVSDLEAVCASNAEPVLKADEPIALRRSIRFESVTFGYGAGREPVLRDFTLDIPRGTTVTLLGPSGSGKTTAADLLMGLLSPEAGRILVDDLPLTRDRIGAWRQSVAYVAQDTFLFHDTIRANLQWAAPHATEHDMHTALRLAAADFVVTLPHRLETIVGDRGLRLSGGERQRIALARALLRRPSLLILDEATSALDAANESRILAAVRDMHGALTILIISHRPSAIAVADAVHVLSNGGIAESSVA